MTIFYAETATENMWARHQTKGHLARVEVDNYETGLSAIPIDARSLCGRMVHPSFEVNRTVELGLLNDTLTCKQCLAKYEPLA